MQQLTRTIARLTCLGAMTVATAAIAQDAALRSRGAIVAAGVAQIVRDHEEASWQDLAPALRLPELTDAPATWSGPFSSGDDPRFTAIYAPPSSSLGIEKVMVEWRLEPPLGPKGKATISRMLTVVLRADSCPTPAEMTAATGSTERRLTFPGPDAGPPRTSRWFDLKDFADKDASILYATIPDCELTAFDKTDW
jgi:hypothetical protein